MPPYEVSLAGPATQDIADILRWSETEFGVAAADRYETLIVQALIDLGENPQRTGTNHRPELPSGVYTYHLAFSRDNVSGEKVKRPRHFLVYRIMASHLEVIRVLHDSRDLARHIPNSN